MNCLESLYQRLRLDPEAHLGHKSVRLIQPYDLGYELGLLRWGRKPLPAKLEPQVLQSWVESKFGWTTEMGCRQNAVGFALLMSIDERDAFDLYFSLYDAADHDPEIEHVTRTDSGVVHDGEGPLAAFLCSDRFRDRPGMWTGGPSVDAIWAICSGYLWAERDLQIIESEDRRLLDGFQLWVESRYPFAQGRPWNRVIDFLCLSGPEKGWNSFFEMFDSYLAGERPESLSSTARAMLSSMAKHVMSNDTESDPDAVIARFTEVTKRICPS